MLVRFNKNVSLDDVGKLTKRCEALDVEYKYIRELSATYIVVESAERSKLDELYHQFRHLPFVDTISYQYDLDDPLYQIDWVKIKCGNRWLGKGSRPVIIAGSPYLESQKKAVTLASDLAAIGVNIYKAGLYRPGDALNPKALYERTSTIITEISRISGIPCTGMIEALASRASISALQPCAFHIPGKLLFASGLRESVAKLGIPIFLERHPNSSTELWLECARTIIREGNSDIALVETGIATGDHREIDIVAIARLIETCPLPIIVDPSRVAQSAEQVKLITRAVLAVGAAGVMIDVHPNPIEGLLTDGFCLSLAQFEEIFQSLKPLIS